MCERVMYEDPERIRGCCLSLIHNRCTAMPAADLLENVASLFWRLAGHSRIDRKLLSAHRANQAGLTKISGEITQSRLVE